MKTALLILSTLVLALSCAAQTVITTVITTNANGAITSVSTTNTQPAAASSGITWNGLLQAGQAVFSDLQGATNWAIAPYASIATANHLNANGSKFRPLGGGVLVLYDFNQFTGAGLGIDELGQLSLVSGNFQLQLPLKPLAFTSWSWATNLLTTPFVYSGVGSPLGGTTGSSVSTHEGEGLNINVAHVLGGSLGGGAAFVQRQGAGKYSGNYISPFIKMSWGNQAF